MRLLPVLFILTSVEAKRRRSGNYQDVRRTKAIDIDVYPNSFAQGQDFSHVYRDGVKGEETDIDPQPKTVEQARELLRMRGINVGVKEKEYPRKFANPRDEMLYKLSSPVNISETGKRRRPQRIKNKTQRTRKPVEEEIQKQYRGNRPKIPDQYDGSSFRLVPKDTDGNKANFFSRNSFQLKSDIVDNYVGNWTTCKEFAKRAVFHPEDVVNIKWVPFYIWSTTRFFTSVVNTFTYPTKKLVKQYKEEFGPYLNMQLDWEEPKLLLKEDKDILLIAGDRKGLFYGIPYLELPNPRKNLTINLTVIIVRLKIVDPYLAMSYCNDKYAAIMSVDGTGPQTDEERAEEATILQFQGLGNPTSRDLELEAHKSKYQVEKKLRDEASKYLNVQGDDILDPSLW